MAYSTLSEIATRVRRTSRQTVDPDEIVDMAQDVLEEIYLQDCQLFQKSVLYTSTDGTLAYSLSGIASDIRKISQVYIDLTNVSTKYEDQNYYAAKVYKQRHLQFKTSDTFLTLRDDPDGDVLTIWYYRTPTAITSISSTIDLPSRWRRLLYYGLMSMVKEGKDESPGVSYGRLYANGLKEMLTSENIKTEGAMTSDYYSLM